MKISIRPYREEDVKAFAEIHYDAVHELAKEYYSEDILEAWSPKVDEERISRVRESADQETRIMAEADGQPIGLGCIVPQLSELRACYVTSLFTGKGVGRKILQTLENIALNQGCVELSLDSSLNAKDFYEKNGYTVIEKSIHMLSAGVTIECYKMKKKLV